MKLTGGAYEIEGYLEYGACDDESCLPPTEVPFKFSGVAKTANAAAAKAEQPEKKEVEKKEEAAPVVSKDTVAMMELQQMHLRGFNLPLHPVSSGNRSLVNCKR